MDLYINEVNFTNRKMNLKNKNSKAQQFEHSSAPGELCHENDVWNASNKQ